MALTDKQRRFVDEYLVDLNATQAAIRAGYSEKTANEQGARLLAKVSVRSAIEEAQKARAERVEITQDDVLRRWIAIATADPNELVQYRRSCCRHCWGIDFLYQWTTAEFERAQREATENSKDLPEILGGLGYDARREPNPECTECAGEGRGHIHVTDTRGLKGPARLLYAGVKAGKDGLEVKMHDQMKALENVARHLGMLKQQHEITGKEGGPIRTKSESADAYRNLSDEQLTQLEAIAAALAGSGGNPSGTRSA